jgi:hypothetical protein
MMRSRDGIMMRRVTLPFSGDVTLESLDKGEPLVKYDLAQRRVVVNRSHPFSREYGQTHEQQLLLRDTAFVELLTEAYMLDMGLTEGQLDEIRSIGIRLIG